MEQTQQLAKPVTLPNGATATVTTNPDGSQSTTIQAPTPAPIQPPTPDPIVVTSVAQYNFLVQQATNKVARLQANVDSATAVLTQAQTDLASLQAAPQPVPAPSPVNTEPPIVTPQS